MASIEQAEKEFAELLERHRAVLKKFVMRYSHRNGEMSAPEITGAYFWYQGLSASSIDIAGIVYVDEMGRASDTFFNMAACHEMQGRWWGPLTPPWESD